MKESKYNIFFDIDSKRYLFNTISCGFAEINDDTERFIKNVHNTNINDLDENEMDIFKRIKNGRMIVDDNYNELDGLKLAFYQTNYNITNLSLTILPTLACNMDCTYCFENKNSTIISDEVFDNTIRFVESRVNRGFVKSMNVNWFGGEPLLFFDKIDNLSQKFIPLCEQHNVNYSASIITNGWLIDEKISQRMVDLKIKDAQITIDGPPPIHDSKRKLKNGEGTFKRIVENILLLSKYIFVTVRINVDVDVKNQFEEMFESIKILGGSNRINVYPGLLRSDTKACASIESSCINIKEYSDVYYDFYSIAKKYRFNLSWYPRPKKGCCCAASPNSLVIQPNGDLCRCWNQVGVEKESYGNIKNPFDIKTPDDYFNWVLFNPFVYEECMECKFMPICLAGCPAVKIPASSDFTKGCNYNASCTPSKYNLNKMLSLVYQDIVERTNENLNNEK